METYKLVLPGDLNHHGSLFGGALLKWVDEYAWIAASLDYPGCRFVTIAMDQVEFRQGVAGGTILCFRVDRTREGRTSVEYAVSVSRASPASVGGEAVFATRVTLVRVDASGGKMPLHEPAAEEGRGP